jgi:hypothetical protein
MLAVTERAINTRSVIFQNRRFEQGNWRAQASLKLNPGSWAEL